MDKKQTLLLSGGFLTVLLILAYSSIDPNKRPFAGSQSSIELVYIILLIVAMLFLGGFISRWRKRK